MLRHEDWVATVGRLLAVVVRLRRCEPLRDQVVSVGADRARAAEDRGCAIAAAQLELRPERLLPDGGDAVVDGRHETKCAQSPWVEVIAGRLYNYIAWRL